MGTKPRTGKVKRRWLRWEYVSCGKARCRKCREGVYHGPYLYLLSAVEGRHRPVRQYLALHLRAQHEDVPVINTPDTAILPYWTP